MAVLDLWTSIIERQDRRAALFGEMMQRFGAFDSGRCFTMADGLALQRAAAVCLGCRAVDECEAWRQRSGSEADAERFCPNASLFRQLGRFDRKIPAAVEQVS